MMTFSAIFPKPGFDTNKVKVVRDNQTVQQVLDSITNASETNKYLVLVPSGHELEYFDWKPNVEVKFLDNLDERWQLDELEGWDDLSNWEFHSGFQKEVVEDYEGKQIKLTNQSGTADYMRFNPNIDLRRYQGILLRFKFPVTDVDSPTSVRIRTYFIETGGGWVGTMTWANLGVGDYDRFLFLPFGIDKFNLQYVDVNKVDWSAVRLEFRFTGLKTNDIVYLSNFKLVRTFPYPCIFLRTDDSNISGNYRVAALREFIKMNFPALWAVEAKRIKDVTTSSIFYPTPGLLHELQKTGFINITNHSFSHPNFKAVDEKETLFEVEVSRFIFERLGLKDALRWWVNPGASTNPSLEKILKAFGYISVYSRNSEIPVSILDYSDIPDNFQPLKKGGIVTLLFHAYNVNTEEEFNELMNKVDNLKQFCRFVGIRDIERLMNNSHEKFSPRQTKPTLFQVLDSDFEMYFYHKQLFLDPNGSDRNINVQPYELRPGDLALIVNTGTTGNLVFDPSGLNLTIQPGQSANVIYDGDQWRQI